MGAKADPHSGPSQKIIALFSLLLFTGRPHSLSQLSDALRCSKQTILRMIEQIERSRWLTLDSWTRNRQRYYQVRTPTRMPSISLDAEGLGKLLLCRDMVWHLLPENYRNEITKTLHGATVLLPQFDERGDALASYTRVKPKGMIDYSAKETIITDLIRAIRERRLCTVHYRGPRHDGPREYAVAPYQIIVFHEGLYLRCRPVELLKKKNDHGDLLLAVHRVLDMKVDAARFPAIEIRTDANQLAGAFGLTKGEPFRVRVRVEAGAAQYVRERIWSDDQQIEESPDGGIVLEFTSTSRQETLAWALSFGGEMELLTPESLRDDITERAAKIAGLHRTG